MSGRGTTAKCFFNTLTATLIVTVTGDCFIDETTVIISDHHIPYFLFLFISYFFYHISYYFVIIRLE